MAKIYIPGWDEGFIDSLKADGLGTPKAPHWIVARIALARSLQLPQFPSEDLERPRTQERGYEIHMEQLTGENSPAQQDFTDDFRLMLSIYHHEDLFADRDRFVFLLQRHIQRGLNELQRSWRKGNDFYDYLYQEMFHTRAADLETSTGTEDAAVRLRRALGEVGVSAQVEEVRQGPRLTRYGLRLGGADDLTRLGRDLDKLAFELGLRQALTLTEPIGERRIGLQVPRPESEWWHPDGTALPAWVKHPELTLPLCPGTDVVGEPYVFDMVRAVHLFVGGTTGSGKSVCLHALLLSLLSCGRDVRLALIDPKQVEFAAYKGSPRLWGDVASDVDQAADLLDGLVEEMERRQQIIAAAGVQTIDEANDRGAGLPRLVLVVDELADLLLQRPESETSLVRLAQKARSGGIHLILATQRPEAGTFSGLLRSNIPSRIALTVRTAQESRIILDETGAERLLMKGDMLVRIAGEATVRVHGVRVQAGDIKAWL